MSFTLHGDEFVSQQESLTEHRNCALLKQAQQKQEVKSVTAVSQVYRV